MNEEKKYSEISQISRTVQKYRYVNSTVQHSLMKKKRKDLQKVDSFGPNCNIKDEYMVLCKDPEELRLMLYADS